EAMQQRQADLATFENQWRSLADAPRNVSERVDYRLLGSALARVRWELDIVGAWRRQPQFYVDQALIPIFELLLPPPPAGRERAEGVIRLLERTPATLAAGQRNVGDMRGPFVDVALAGLDRVAPSLRGMATGLEPFMTAAQVRRTQAAIERAVAAFE